MSRQDGTGRITSDADIDDRGATILHADLDAFFASVELLSRPELRGQPVVVGHLAPRSVVTAATYEARRFGVNSAMPMAVAMRRCPQAVVIEPDFAAYRHWSAVFFDICHSLTPMVEEIGIDEGFLDVSGAVKAIGTPRVVAERLRERVRAETGLVCSVGAASTKFVAKLASAKSKPDGLLIIPADGVPGFLHPLPVADLWGVGGRTQERLAGHGVRTIGELAALPQPALQALIGAAAAKHLHELANGVDPRRVTLERVEQSVGREETFAVDVTEVRVLRRELLRLADDVGRRLRRGGMLARTVAIKLRWDDFSTVQRSRTLAEASASARVLHEVAQELLEQLAPGGLLPHPVRLIGIRGEQLLPVEQAPTALWREGADWDAAERTVDRARERFGRGAVRPASLTPRPGGPPPVPAPSEPPALGPHAPG